MPIFFQIPELAASLQKGDWVKVVFTTGQRDQEYIGKVKLVYYSFFFFFFVAKVIDVFNLLTQLTL